MHGFVGLAFVGLLLASPICLAADEIPPIFAKKSFDEARAATKGNDRILVVKATAVWCGPCKQMDKTTWRDEKVIKWFDANGLAIQIDVDKQPEVSRALKVEAMPTMVAFKNAEEFDRVVGFRGADDLLAWLEAVKRGERSSDKALKQLAELKSGRVVLSSRDRMELLQTLVRMDKLDEATEQYAEFWETSKSDVGMGGVRGSFLANDMERLAKRHPAALQKFRAMRDALEKTFTSDTAREAAAQTDWITLNDVVGEPARTLAWFDRIKDKRDRGEYLESHVFRIEKLLEENERWADLGRLWKDPIGELKKSHGQLASMLNFGGGLSAERKKELEAAMSSNFRTKAGHMYVGLLAAGREKDAEEVADEAISLDDSAAMRMALVNAALSGKQARRAQIGYLKGGQAAAAAEKCDRELAALQQRLNQTLQP